MRTVKILFAALAMLAALAVCGYLLYTFHIIGYLPVWVNYTMRGLCAVGIIASIALFVTYLKSLGPAPGSKPKKRKASSK